MAKTNIDNYDNFLKELIEYCLKGVKCFPSQIMIAHNVNQYSIKALIQLGHIEILEGSVRREHKFKYHDKGKTAEEVVDSLIEELKKFQPGSVVKTEPPPKPPENSINFGAAMDNMLQLMDIGIKYGVEKDQLKEFVKEVMIVKLAAIKS